MAERGPRGQRPGFNVNPLRTTTAPDILVGVELVKTGDFYDLASTQDHWSLEGRNFVRVGTSRQFAQNPEFAQKMELQPVPARRYPRGQI